MTIEVARAGSIRRVAAFRCEHQWRRIYDADRRQHRGDHRALIRRTRNILEAEEMAHRFIKLRLRLAASPKIAAVARYSGFCQLHERRLDGLPLPHPVRVVGHHVGRAMVVRLDHLRFVKRQEDLLAFHPAIALELEAVCFERRRLRGTARRRSSDGTSCLNLMPHGLPVGPLRFCRSAPARGGRCLRDFGVALACGRSGTSACSD